MVVGSLRRPADALVPVVAALAGGRDPALVYLAVNRSATGNPRGWAIPAATDIAFALAVLAVVGSSLPSRAAGVPADARGGRRPRRRSSIIAVFYTSTLHLLPLLVRGARCSRRTPCCSGCA